MRARVLAFTVALVVLAFACVGTTGDAIVDFPAAAAGPSDATVPLTFSETDPTGATWSVSLTQATLHIGALYLDQSVPTSGSQGSACILPGIYVAQETTGMDVDLLSPAPQVFPALAHGTTLPALAGQVWLTGGDINASDDVTPILQVAGTATNGTTSFPFTGKITIGSNRQPANSSATPGEDSICQQRIVSPIHTSVAIGGAGGLLLRVDPRLLFTNVEFNNLTASGGTYAFSDDPTSTDYTQPSINLFHNLKSAGSLYSFSWDDALTPGAADAGAPDSAVAEGGTFVTPQDPGPDGVLFAVSGEALALTGYPFPPTTSGGGAFVDGWDVKFSRLLVTVDKLTLSQNPDFSPGDQSQTGPVVAEVDGPWAVDLSHSDPSYLAGKGGPGEEAVPIAALTNQNLNDHQSFATDGTRYAFGFQAVAATSNALNVNMDAAGQADYQEMISNGCTILYEGTATFKGGTVTGHTDCNSDPEYADWPQVINFKLCYKSPTSYLNCQNPDNDPALPIGADEHQRGIAFFSDKSVIAQVTIHTDHPFWDSVLHDSPAHFDQFAARVAGQADAGTVPTVTLEMTEGVDYTAVTDALGRTINWRYCMDPPTDVHPQYTGIMSFDPESVAHATNNNPANGLRDYYDYTTYDQSTQGHLNSDGLCFVKRNYPSPP